MMSRRTFVTYSRRRQPRVIPSHFSGVVTITCARLREAASGVTSPVSSRTVNAASPTCIHQDYCEAELGTIFQTECFIPQLKKLWGGTNRENKKGMLNKLELMDTYEQGGFMYPPQQGGYGQQGYGGY